MYQIFTANKYEKIGADGKLYTNYSYKIADVRPFATLEELFTKGAEELKAKGHNLENVYYTLAYHERGSRSRKAWRMQEYIPFDLDGIDQARIDDYPELACKALGLTLEDATVVYSGNGIQLLFKVEQITKEEFIFENKNNWLRAYEKITKALTDAGYSITRDTTAWDYARLFRLPGTINRKQKKNDKGELVDVVKNCRLVRLSDNVVPLPFDYAAGHDIPNVSMPAGSFGVPDAPAIIKGCDFFRWLEQTPSEVHEPHAYAMLSVTGHFTDQSWARELYAKFDSPSINKKTFEEFTEQATTASGPRTCDGINNIWGKCAACPHYRKVTSPIQIKGDGHIGTRELGFTTRAGKQIVRQYRELALFMAQELSFKVMAITKTIYAYNGTHYEIYPDNMVKAYAERHFSQPVKERERGEFLNLVHVTNILAGEDEAEFLAGKNTEGFINFRNGVLNLETGALYPHGANFHFHYCLPYDYDPSAKAPNWQRFLDQITLGRPELQNILHEYMGYIVAGGEYVYQKALILSGSGKNGKSTFVSVLKEITGRGNFSSIPLSSLSSQSFYMAEMQGKLVNISEEEPPTCFKETGIFKNLTGNNTVQAQRKFEKPFSFLSKAKIVITYNEMPFISDTTTGMRRRLMVVPFDLDLESTPELVDVKIMDKLRAELPGIFNLALEGFRRLEDRGAFTKSGAVDESVREIFDFNTFDFWYEETLEKSDDLEAFIPCKDAYESYLEYCKGMAEGRQHYGLKKFGNEMKRRGYKSKVVRKGPQVYRVYGGLTFDKSAKVSAKF